MLFHVPNPAAPQSATYIVYHKNPHLYLPQIIVNVHNDFILGWKIVYLSAQHLSFCLYLIIAIGHAFFFHLLFCQTPYFKLIDAPLLIPEVNFYIYCFRLLSWIGAIPVSCSKCGSALLVWCATTFLPCINLLASTPHIGNHSWKWLTNFKW